MSSTSFHPPQSNAGILLPRPTMQGGACQTATTVQHHPFHFDVSTSAAMSAAFSSLFAGSVPAASNHHQHTSLTSTACQISTETTLQQAQPPQSSPYTTTGTSKATVQHKNHLQSIQNIAQEALRIARETAAKETALSQPVPLPDSQEGDTAKLDSLGSARSSSPTQTSSSSTTTTKRQYHQRSSSGRLNKFVRRLHDMLKVEQGLGVVEWRRGLLVLHSTHVFAKKLLPKYFNTRNFKTFRRQLNYYGFIHIRSFSTTGDSTTALWVNQELAQSGGTAMDEDDNDVGLVLKMRRVEPDESAKTVEGRRVRKREALSTVEHDLGVNARSLQLDQIRTLALKGACAVNDEDEDAVDGDDEESNGHDDNDNDECQPSRSKVQKTSHSRRTVSVDMACQVTSIPPFTDSMQGKDQNSIGLLVKEDQMAGPGVRRVSCPSSTGSHSSDADSIRLGPFSSSAAAAAATVSDSECSNPAPAVPSSRDGTEREDAASLLLFLKSMSS